MDNEKSLSIVIASWNTKDLLSDCLNSIQNLEEYSENIEVIVIDNGSKDGTPEIIKSEFPSVKLIINEHNKGYAQACNQGIREARGRYILLLGSDTMLKNGCLSLCMNFLNEHDDLGAVGCKLIYPDGRLQGNCKKFPKLINALFTYLSLDKLNYDYDMQWFHYNETIPVDQIATTFLMIKADFLKGLKGFNEKYRFLYNDVDLCRRIWKSGKSIYFLNTAEVIHHGSYSTNRATFGLRARMYFDIFKYFWNYHGITSLILTPVLLIRLIIVSILKK